MTAYLGDVIGALTLTGSAVAFGKLHGVLGSAALNLPGGWVGGGRRTHRRAHLPAGVLLRPCLDGCWLGRAG